MTKGLTQNARVAMTSRLRRTAMMSAAATAFMGAARSLYAGVSVEPVTTVQAAVKEALSGGKKPPVPSLAAVPAGPVTISAIGIGNGDDISVGPDETAISTIVTEPIYRPGPFGDTTYSWSPDSKWIAYTTRSRAQVKSACVYSIEKRQSFPLTDGLSDVSEPVTLQVFSDYV